MFSSKASGIEIECDAPPYPIVQACGQLGFHSPEDVRWDWQESAATPQGPSGVPFRLLQWLFGKRKPVQGHCVCGRETPRLNRYIFTLSSGEELHLFLGQCPRCSTMTWHRA